MTERDQAYWESKHPLVRQLYQGRPLPDGGKFQIDVRHFIWPDDISLKEVITDAGLWSEEPDEAAQACQEYVVKHLTYVSDSTLGSSEYWLFPAETLAMRQGDCEDGAILIASLLLNCLPPDQHWRVRVSAGYVQAGPTAPQGGHGYATYCRKLDNEWVVLDWCYMQDSRRAVHKKPMHKDNKPYKDVWFSFNHLHAWSHQTFQLSGRVTVPPDELI